MEPLNKLTLRFVANQTNGSSSALLKCRRHGKMKQKCQSYSRFTQLVPAGFIDLVLLGRQIHNGRNEREAVQASNKRKKEVAGKEEGEKVSPKRAQRVHSHLPQENTSLSSPLPSPPKINFVMPWNNWPGTRRFPFSGQIFHLLREAVADNQWVLLCNQ